MRSDLSFLLLDSVGKKVRCVEEFRQTLELQNVATVWGRAEEIAKQKENAHRFDCVVSRAVAYLPQVIEWALPFLSFGGKILLLKTPSIEEWNDGQQYASEKKLLLKEQAYEMDGITRQILIVSFK